MNRRRTPKEHTGEKVGSDLLEAPIWERREIYDKLIYCEEYNPINVEYKKSGRRGEKRSMMTLEISKENYGDD